MSRTQIKHDENLVDIGGISVNTTVDKEKRMMDYVFDIKNPYRFRVDDITVNLKFNKEGRSLHEAIRRAMLRS